MGIKGLKGTTLKPILLFLGAYFFSVCLTILIHEFGHALALATLNYPDISILATPFYGATTSSTSMILSDVACILIAGPIFNLLCATMITLILWRARSPYLLPLLIYGGTAYLTEGVVIFNTFFTNTVLTDWDGLIYLGLSPFIVAVIAGVVLSMGTLFMYLVWPLANISIEDSFLRKLAINSGYVFYPILSIAFLMLSNLLILPELMLLIILNTIVGISLLLIRIALYKPLFPFIDRLTHTDVKVVKWSSVWFSLGLGFIMFLFLILFFN
jgi:hypothetical protein